MKVLVVGASRGTGALCVKSALAKGHSVTAFSRTPAKLDVTHPALTRVAGDFHDAASVRSAVAGHDAVIICASPSSLGGINEKPDYFSRGTKCCIDAMKEHGVRRIVNVVGVRRTAVAFLHATRAPFPFSTNTRICSPAVRRPRRPSDAGDIREQDERVDEIFASTDDRENVAGALGALVDIAEALAARRLRRRGHLLPFDPIVKLVEDRPTASLAPVATLGIVTGAGGLALDGDQLGDDAPPYVSRDRSSTRRRRRS